MYNEEFKKQYIEDDTTNRCTAVQLPLMFRTIASDEERLGKDLCNFTITDIEDYYNGLGTSSMARCLNIRSQFIKYSQYCQLKGLIKDNQIHWLEVDRNFLLRCINTGKRKSEFVSRKQLLLDIQKFLNPVDQFIVLGLFEGICGYMYTDFRHISTLQFTKTNGGYWVSLADNERVLKVSDKLFEIAVESENEYRRYTENNIDGKLIYNQADPYIVKEKNNVTNKTMHNFMRVISNTLSALKKEYDLPYLTQAALTNSGRVNYIHENLREGESLFDYITQNASVLEQRYGKMQSVKEIMEHYHQLY